MTAKNEQDGRAVEAEKEAERKRRRMMKRKAERVGKKEGA